jgi:hypothetical protein
MSNAGRKLTRHEIVQEAETLIRNALYRGTNIGAWDLVKYLQDQYSNKRQELYEGVLQAWRKVEWEDEALVNDSAGPGRTQSDPTQQRPEHDQEESEYGRDPEPPAPPEARIV